MHTTWANDPVNSPNHYTRSHPGMECIELTADTSFCLGNAIKYLWRYHSKGRPVEDLEKARWYLCHVIDHDEKIAWTRQQHAILDTLANDPAIPDAEAHTWAKLRQGFPYSALACLDRLIEHERNQQRAHASTATNAARKPANARHCDSACPGIRPTAPPWASSTTSRSTYAPTAPNDSTTRPSAPSTYAETTETSSAPTCSNTSPPI